MPGWMRPSEGVGDNPVTFAAVGSSVGRLHHDRIWYDAVPRTTSDWLLLRSEAAIRPSLRGSCRCVFVPHLSNGANATGR